MKHCGVVIDISWIDKVMAGLSTIKDRAHNKRRIYADEVEMVDTPIRAYHFEIQADAIEAIAKKYDVHQANLKKVLL